MAFDGNEGTMIPLLEAISTTTAFRNSGMSSINGYFLGKNKIQELLQQNGAMGIRFYFTISQGELNIVAAAADANEADITAKTLNAGSPCPPQCRKSVLNS